MKEDNILKKSAKYLLTPTKDRDKEENRYLAEMLTLKGGGNPVRILYAPFSDEVVGELKKGDTLLVRNLHEFTQDVDVFWHITGKLLEKGVTLRIFNSGVCSTYSPEDLPLLQSVINKFHKSDTLLTIKNK